MDRTKPTNQHLATARPQAAVEVVTADDIVLLSVIGLVDERFKGFGTVGTGKTVVINVSGITRMTSFGVRQWLNAIDSLPKTFTEVLLLGCPTFFVDQLNMVLNFGGAAKVLTVVAPYTCPSCGVESGEMIDVLTERANLSNGAIPEKECTRCGGKLEFDETPESYFSFVGKYGASAIQHETAQLLATHGLYTSAEAVAEKPPRIIKLVDGSVTYFRIIGRIGSMFRARPFLVGAEGEVVIDLEEVDAFDPAGQKEWRRLLKNLSSQDITVTLVDVKDPFFVAVGDSFAMARNIVIETLLVPYVCIACRRRSHQSKSLRGKRWPPHFEDGVCATCGGLTRHEVSGATLVHLKKANTDTPPASAHLIEHRSELLARAMTDASASENNENATPPPTSDSILGKYKIVRRLSSGGFAEVFLAKQVGIGGFEKPVVLKKLQSSLLDKRELAVDMFLNEVKVAGRLTHPNIVQILDVGEVGGALYLAMEYVNGKSLRDVLDRLEQADSVMPVAEACYVAREVAQALDHAYWSTDMRGQRLSVVHGDVSPHNIMLSYDGTVKVLDFGVAMSISEGGDVQYMAPEAATGTGLDHRSDLFAIGVLLYQLCSGTTPFPGSTYKDVLKKIKSGRYWPLHEASTVVPAKLSSLVASLLSANVEDRPQRGQEVVAELTEIGRRSSLESSGSNIAKFLAQLYPEDVVAEPSASETMPLRSEPNRQTLPPDSIAFSRTKSGRATGLDASISFVGRPRDTSIAPKNVTPVPRRDITGTVPRVRSSLLSTLLIVLVIALISVGAYLFVVHGG